jgi:NarL family two-component system response regulator LiaR
MDQSQPIQVMIVDDHPVVRTGLTAMLYPFDDLEVVGEASSGPETLAKCREALPDVILMDLLMPNMDGLETTIAVLDQYPTVKIVILTSFPGEALRLAYAGQPVLAPEATQALIQARTRSQRPGHDLSERERQVLALIVKGLSNAEIAQQLSISPATARNHVSACLSKLGAANRAQAAALAVEYQIAPKKGATV